NNGSASVTPSGGTAPFNYLWNTGAIVDTIVNLAPGNYSVILTDDNGCQAFDTVVITVPAILAANAIGNNVTCNGFSNGSATASANGGTAPYSYVWNTGVIGATITNLNPGNYTVTASDANGCTSNANVTITEPTLLLANATGNNITCNGLNNGSAAVVASGGTAPYTYQWSTGSTATSITNLALGNYIVTVTDSNGCIATDNVTVTEPTILLAVASGNNVTCNGFNNGSGSVAPTGGTAPYGYVWNTGGINDTITNLAPGSYNVTVTDANGCITSANTTITEPAILTATASSTNVTCNGINNGTASVSQTGGTAPYTYLWSNGGMASTISNLAPGSYTVTVTDANGCATQSSVNITQPNALVVNSAITLPILCNGGIGQINVTASGGVLPYTGTGLNSVNAGTYTYTVVDGNGCNDSTTITITEPSLLTVSVIGINPLCNGSSNGSATANVNGGTAPYIYNWTNGSTLNIASGLSAGNYSVTVTDANGCQVSGSVQLTQPNALTASSVVSSPILCFGGSGQVTVSANGGTLPYTGTGANIALAGNNTFTVTDANGCTASTTINVPQPTQIVASSAIASAIPCFGGTGNIIVTAVGGTPNYSGTGTYNVPVGTYTYTVTDANGCSNATTISITQPTALTPTATITSPIPCFGGNASISVTAIGGTPGYNGTGNFTATAGVQNYTVTDANGCSAVATINIPQPALLTSSIASQNVTCNGLNNGSATVNASGGTSPYNYLWSNGAITSTVINLSPGAYSVTVTDNNGCQSISNVIITQPTILTSTLTQTSNVLCFGGTANVFVAASGGTAPYAGIGTFSVVAGNSFFTVSDANGCTS
ncbi:MAG: hypothetical protein EB023_10360, partial [Flavobacteriia bacterium]|nr:hypothetical protein [Flavobacteriia bacterium]